MASYPFLEIAVTIGADTLFGEALPDTGYDGALIVPVEFRREIATAAERRILTMPDRHQVLVDSWDGKLLLGDRSFDVRIYAFDELFIIGREVLDQVEICFEFGRRVRIRFDGEGV